jgi:hypothetical protein
MPQSPPEEIVEEGADAIGAQPSEPQVDAIATVAHVAFGATGGAAFGALANAFRPRMPELLGIPLALAIWATSYFGWIPALHVLPAPDRDVPGRAWTMFLVHLAYGAALGALWRGVDVARTGAR